MSTHQLRFDGRTAIVTGAGRGLGRAHAMLLAARGANVVVNDLGGSLTSTSGDRESVAESVSREIRDAGGSAVADAHSVDTPEGGAAIVDAAIEAFGSIDIVVNNAGIIRDRSAHNMSTEEFDDVLRVHLRGAFNVTRPAYVRMRAQGYGRIVMTSSHAGLYGTFGQLNYASAKMGLVGMAKTLSREGSRWGVLANVVAPGAATRMTDAVIGEARGALSVDHVAPVVAWLCHESCTLDGEVLVAFGGRVARAFVGETMGIFEPDLTIETVATSLDRIMKLDGYEVFPDASAAMDLARFG